MTQGRYTAAAILLHWTIALFIGANVLLGWWMSGAIDDAGRSSRAIAAFQVHKSIGLTVLALSLLRLGLRLAYRPPAPPERTPVLQRRLSLLTHWLFYGLMIAIPLSGWLLVSAQWRGTEPLVVPTLWFGLFEVPHLFGLNEAAPANREALWQGAVLAHEVLVIGTLALLALHVGAVLKHRFIDDDDVLQRMWTAGGAGASKVRRWTLRGGYVALGAIGAVVALQLFSSAPAPAVRADTASITSMEGGQRVIAAESHIRFSGTHAGNAFEGSFTRWRADIRIDSAQPEHSSIEVVVDTASATDGVALHDETLPGPEWFDVDEHPTAVYASDAVRSVDGAYEIDGTLTIKGNRIDVPPLQLVLENSRAVISGSITLDRADADIGMESDPRGRWVSREIGVDVRASVAFE